MGNSTATANASEASRQQAQSTEFSELDKKLRDQCATPVRLSMDFLKAITSDFSEEQELGRGGFGVVYKGVLQNGKAIAVKKFYEVSLDDDQFHREVTYLFGLKHKNIVQLLGYCAESHLEAAERGGKYVMAEVRKGRLLCFEYINNMSLDKHFSAASHGLEWHTRYETVRGICRSLDYLHTECKIVHLDLKPQNILLDDKMEPKITDFGMCRLFDPQQSRIISEVRVGTRGYIAPEYLDHGLISIKADIYSLGVIIIQIMTGCREYPITEESHEHFTDDVVRRWRTSFEKARRYMFLEKYIEQVRTCILIALNCVDTDRNRRPTARDILEKLTQLDIITNTDGGPHGTQLVHWNDVPIAFTMGDLLLAEADLLGRTTAYGIMYKAILEDGNILVVRRLSHAMIKGHDEFKAGIAVLGKVRHPNLLALKAYYLGAGDVFVVFDYMPMGSLSALLHAESYDLEWHMRYEIIRGICHGLHYLHTECQIVHLDLKPENILLDDNVVPKIKDFGTSWLFAHQHPRAITNSRGGKLGYMAPEYLAHGLISAKADVFSFGVIIIELITGCRDYPITQEDYEQFIENVTEIWRKTLQEAGRYKPLERYVDQVRTCILIGLNCVDPDPKKRPTAGCIIEMLREEDSCTPQDGQTLSEKTKMNKMKKKTHRVQTVCSLIENMRHARSSKNDHLELRFTEQLIEKGKRDKQVNGSFRNLLNTPSELAQTIEVSVA